MSRIGIWSFITALCVAVPGCKGSAGSKDAGAESPDAGLKPLTLAQLKDPESCMHCHPIHYKEWSGSMHAYAANDPVFLAMNRRGQEETEGKLGKFCIKCHAPMAVRDLPEATDWSKVEPDKLAAGQKGITCYFCHNAVGIKDHFNADVTLANDTTMRGGITDPVQPGVHKAAGSAYHDRHSLKSAELCGGCHDIVTPAPHNVELERTYKEYLPSVFTQECTKDVTTCGFQSCQSCHMPTTGKGVAADTRDIDVPLRSLHSHMWPGVDVALTKFPEREAQRTAVQNALNYSIQYCALQIEGSAVFADPVLFDKFSLTLTLETRAGHAQPSGASQDRRMWVEFVAYDADGKIIDQKGVVADGALEEKPADDPDAINNPLVMRDRIFDEAGKEVHMFWEAATVEQGCKLPATKKVVEPEMTACPLVNAGHSLPVSWSIVKTVNALHSTPAKVRIRVLMRPMGRDVLNDLVDSGHLDAKIADEMPTFTVLEMEAKWNDPKDPQAYTVTERDENNCEF